MRSGQRQITSKQYLTARTAMAAGAILLMLILVIPAAAGAYTVEKHNDPATGQLLLSPPKVEVDVKPGDGLTRDIIYANRTDSTQTVEFSTEDFIGSQDPNQDYVLEGDKDSPFSARHWLQPEVSSMTLKPGEVLTFQVRINVPQNAEPGGHYAALFATAKNSQNADSQSSQVNMTPRIGTLFLFRVAGNINENGNLDSPNVPGFTEYGPINIGLVFNNTGNVHVKPQGKIFVSNMLGQTVAELNVDPWTVLPDSSRKTQVKWDSKLLFGRYTVRAEIDYGSGDSKVIMTATFWAIPWKIILAVISSLIIIVILLSWATRGRRQAKAAQNRKIRQLPDNYEAAAAGAASEEKPSWENLAGTRPAAAPASRPSEPATAATDATPEASSLIPLNELFPSIDDQRVIDINDDETRKLLRTMIDNELDLARAYITEGKVEEARKELMEARGAAQKIGLLSEVGLIDDMLDWV